MAEKGTPDMSNNQTVVYDTPASIAMYKLHVTITYAEGRARGIHMTDPRKARGVQLKRLREVYGISARRWEQAAAELRGIMEQWSETGVPEEFCVR